MCCDMYPWRRRSYLEISFSHGQDDIVSRRWKTAKAVCVTKTGLEVAPGSKWYLNVNKTKQKGSKHQHIKKPACVTRTKELHKRQQQIVWVPAVTKQPCHRGYPRTVCFSLMLLHIWWNILLYWLRAKTPMSEASEKDFQNSETQKKQGKKGILNTAGLYQDKTWMNWKWSINTFFRVTALIYSTVFALWT